MNQQENELAAIGASIPRDIAIIKVENEQMQAMATARPRDLPAILSELRSQLEAFPEFAKQAVYAKPVGKDDKGNQKIARGLSIRAAEAIQEAYGYCRIATSVDPIEGHPDKVKVTATFTDYQRGRVIEDSSILSRFYKARGGGMVRIDDDRFFGVTVRAEVAKRFRDVVLRSVSAGLKLQLWAIVEEAAGKILTPETVKAIIAQFASKKVTLPMLERLLGRQSTEWTKDDRINLIGTWNSLNQEGESVESIFGESEETAADTQQETKGKSLPKAKADPEAAMVKAVLEQLAKAQTPEELDAILSQEAVKKLSEPSRNKLAEFATAREQVIFGGRA